VTYENSGNDWNKIEVSVEIPVPARFRARDRKEFLQKFEPSEHNTSLEFAIWLEWWLIFIGLCIFGSRGL
jgi:hypothetical protein